MENEPGGVEEKADEAVENLRKFSDEGLVRVLGIACRNEVEIQEWKKQIEKEIARRKTSES
jgi:phage terminase large subunit-like protein